MSDHENIPLFAKLDRNQTGQTVGLDNYLHFLCFKNLLKSFMQFAHWFISNPSWPFSCGSHIEQDDFVLLQGMQIESCAEAGLNQFMRADSLHYWPIQHSVTSSRQLKSRPWWEILDQETQKCWKPELHSFLQGVMHITAQD